MNDNFRYLTLEKIAASAGLLTSFVEKHLNIKPKFKTLGSVGPGTTVMMSEDAVKPDGSVDILINIRGIAGGDVKTISNLGVKAVVITAEAVASSQDNRSEFKKKNMGSAALQQQFGNSAWVNQAVGKVLNHLKKEFPDRNVKLGKLALSGFSGGGSVVAGLLAQKNQLPPISGVVINDGLHADKGGASMEAVKEYALEAAKDPTKKLKIIHTSIEPGKYRSTTDTANELLEHLQLQRQPVTDWKGSGVKPIATAQKGGVLISTLYQSGKKPKNVEDLKREHIEASKSLADYTQDLFS